MPPYPAWDCPCGARNSPVFASCRVCGGPMAAGTPLGYAQPRAHRRNPVPFIIPGIILPLAGLIIGFIKAFDPDPEERRCAGYGFAGFFAGILLYVWLVGYVKPAVDRWGEERRQEQAAQVEQDRQRRERIEREAAIQRSQPTYDDSRPPYVPRYEPLPQRVLPPSTPTPAPSQVDRGRIRAPAASFRPTLRPAPGPRDPDVSPSEILNHPDAEIGPAVAAGVPGAPTRLGFGLRPRPGDLLPCGHPAARVADPGWHGFRTYYCARGHVCYSDDAARR